jgi:hypothetical protein
MHYLGMLAMEMEAEMHHNSLMVAASVVIAIIVSMVGLWIAFTTSGMAKIRQRLYHRSSGVRHALQRNVWSKLHRSGKADSKAASEYLGFQLRLDRIYQRHRHADPVHQRDPRRHSGSI